MRINQLCRYLNTKCELTHKVIELLNEIDFVTLTKKQMDKVAGVNEYICWIGSKAYITPEFEEFSEEYQLVCVLAEYFSWEKYYQGECTESICLEISLTAPPYAPRKWDFKDLSSIQQCITFNIHEVIEKYKHLELPQITSQKAELYLEQLIREGDAWLGEVNVSIATEKYCKVTLISKSLTQTGNPKVEFTSTIYYDFRKKKLISSLSRGYKEFQKEIEIINSLTQGVG